MQCPILVSFYKHQNRKKIHWCNIILLLCSVCQYQHCLHTERCPIKSYRKKQAAFVPLVRIGADFSQAGSHGWLGATKALVSWHDPAFQMLSRPATVCVCVCLLYVLVQDWLKDVIVSAGRQRGREKETLCHREKGTERVVMQVDLNNDTHALRCVCVLIWAESQSKLYIFLTGPKRWKASG